MFPVLLSVGPFKLYTLAVIAFIAFFAGLFVIWKRGRELHFEEKELFDVIFVVLFWMFVGARLGYILLHIPDFYSNFGKWINVVHFPGWYFPTGMISAVIAVFALSKKQKWDPYQLMDVLVTGMVLIQAFLSLGSFLSGVGYGLPTTSFVGLPFVGVYDRRYPVQLFEMLGFLLCFGYLWWAEGVYRTFSWYRRKRSQAVTGFLLGMYLIWWGVINLISYVFKSPEMVFGFVRFDIVEAILVSLSGVWVLLYRSGVTFGDLWMRILSYFGLGKTHNQKIKERLSSIHELLDE